jgi:hypothetical protein
MCKHSVEQDEIRRHLDHFTSPSVIRSVGRSDQQTEKKRHHRTDQSHRKLDDILGLRTEVMLGNDGLKDHSEHGSADVNAAVKLAAQDTAVAPPRGVTRESVYIWIRERRVE